MREPPPPQLTALLMQLGLAADRDLESVEANVHRIAGTLPRFESVWVDAFRQARILTHFQASEIHAGKGNSLKVGRYVLCQPIQECDYATVYRAEDRASHEIVRLAVFPLPSETDGQRLVVRLENLCAEAKGLPHYAGFIESVGSDESHAWAASPWFDGISIADWMLHHGRLPPDVVLEIARAMLGELVALEAARLTHGDIRLPNILIAKDGAVCLPHPGLVSVTQSPEGHAYQGQSHEMVSTLAPERVAHGMPPTVASDLFACGCVWWHMLCGRPPLGGGDTLARLRAAQAASIGDLRQWAVQVPDPLVKAVQDCLQKDPQRRPKSFADLSARLGPLRRPGRQTIVKCLAAAKRPRVPWQRSSPDRKKKPNLQRLLTGATLAFLATLAVAWPIWVARNRPHTTAIIADQIDTSKAKPAGQVAEVRPALPPGSESHSQPSHPRISDPALTPASHTEESPLDSTGSRFSEISTEIRLPSDHAVRGDELQLKPGQRVVAASGRARILVPRGGLSVTANRVSFENIDFIADDRVDRSANRDESAALIRLLAAECDFAGCSFQSANGSPDLRAAIDWRNASAGDAGEKSNGFATSIGLFQNLELPSGRVRMRDCLFRRVRAAIELRFRGAVALELINCLHLGPGPMIYMAQAPAADEPVHIRLSQVTLREADALLDCRSIGADDRSGEIGIEASGCVLAPRPEAALLVLTAQSFPRQLLRGLKWAGQGSVVAGQVVFARWSQPGGNPRTIDDSTIAIAGLVRGEVEFAGRFDGQPGNSRIVSCQAALQDSDSAGAAVGNLAAEIK
jgi:eukaryotic-like serine/threonine-protein kinase